MHRKPQNYSATREVTSNDDFSPSPIADGAPAFSSKRRSVACNSCHALKVRCEPFNKDDPKSPCLRCHKSKRKCDYDIALAKRRRKAVPDVKVAELENQVQSLKNEITRMNRLLSVSVPTTMSAPASHAPSPVSAMGNSLLPPPHLLMGSGHLFQSMLPRIVVRPTETNKLQRELDMLTSIEQEHLPFSTSSVLSVSEKRRSFLQQKHPDKIDPVSKGLLSESEAEERLETIKQHVMKKYPFISVSSNSTVNSLRTETPLLFATMMSVASMFLPHADPEDKDLCLEVLVIETLTREVLVAGNKSIELLKSLLTLCVWYNSPEVFHHRRYHIINSLCLTMIHDLALSGRPYFFYNREEGSIRRASLDKADTKECARLMLMVYLTTIAICLFLRRKIYVSWSENVEEAFLLLRSSSSPQDKAIALYASLNHLLEKIFYSVQSKSSTEDFNSARMTYIITDLQRQLDLIRLQFNVAQDDYSVLAYFYSVQAYLHEPELQKLAPNTDEANNGLQLSQYVIDSIERCCNSCITALRNFLNCPPDEVAMMPLFYASRITYTAGMLLRLRYFCLSMPSVAKYNLVSEQALTLIQDLSTLFFEASERFPRNNFLGKLRLVITLFVQTYANQIRSIMGKNAETEHSAPSASMAPPQQFPQGDSIPSNGGGYGDFKGAEPLEYSYRALNDEFWSDLLTGLDANDFDPSLFNMMSAGQ